MPPVRNEKELLQVKCPSCGIALNLRLPEGENRGSFNSTCYACGSDIDVNVLDARKNRLRLSISRGQRSRAVPSDPRIKKSRKMPLKISALILLVAGILGILSSISTVMGSFSIRDIEEQTKAEYTSLSVTVIDSVTGRPIEGVRVTVGYGNVNYTEFTDSSGLAVLKGLPPSSGQITLQKEGYRGIESNIMLKKGIPNVLDIPMEEGESTDVMPILTPQFVGRTYSTLLTDIMAMVMFLASVMAFVGAYYTYRGEFFILAIISAFLSIFSFGFFIGSVLSAGATISIIFSYDSFSHTHVLRQLLESSRGDKIMSRI